MSQMPPSAPAAPYLSVVIPAYNEEIRISRTICEVVSYLSVQPYEWEIIVADDGSSDATTRLTLGAAAGDPRVRVLPLSHGGKGWAVRHGMLAAGGEFRLLCDADLSVPIAQVERLLPPAADVDVAVGSREAPGAARYGEPGRRHLMGRVYNALARQLAAPGLADTQCGFKCFRAGAADRLFGRSTINGFSYDVEVLHLARRSGMTVAEIGIDWHYREHSKVRPFRDAFSMALDLLRIRWRHRGYSGR
jgi:dolichyl-phosphate beta-glucosyltransferase